ncbi:hypothetical protein [Thermomonas sp.]|uniref:hypothetical protein n=1 Tax=Thermomonas sp. TaxID=1971895 RepID=UPI00262A9BA7|nr:hypothetical protein [Thermomonas sp.]MCO5055525.1 hypothetical protein [Thermomonas sp.]
MRPSKTLCLLACLVLLGCAGQAAAREPQRAAPEAVDPPDAASSQGERSFDGDIDAAVAGAHAAQRATKPAARTATPAPTRSSGDARTLPSRFHSFLPGMFR